MAFAPAGGFAALSAWTLVAALGCAITLGLLWTWRQTVGAAFVSLASYKVKIKFAPDIHPFGVLGGINNAVESHLSSWAAKQEKSMGLALHYIAELWGVMTKEIAQLSQDSLAANHWMRYKAIPAALGREINPLKSKTNKAAAAAGAAAAAAMVAKKAAQGRTRHDEQTQAATKATATHAEKVATQAKTAARGATHTAAQTAVITVAHPSVTDLPVPFGRTIAQIKKRLARAETWVGATALSVAMANVLGVTSSKCLRDGPLGRVSRTLCGIPTRFLNDLLGLLADFFILENICMLLPLLEEGASVVGTPLIEGLTELGAGLCQGNTAPAALQGPKASVPALIFGVSASGV